MLWGLLKGNFYTNKPCAIDDLKENIQEIVTVPVDMLRRVFATLVCGVKLHVLRGRLSTSYDGLKFYKD
jgi:hypothetical protein